MKVTVNLILHVCIDSNVLLNFLHILGNKGLLFHLIIVILRFPFLAEYLQLLYL